MKKILVIAIFIFVLIPTLSGCSNGIKAVKEVNVYEMESFAEVKKDSLVTFTDEKAIKRFKKAFSSAKKLPGVVDMADPDYKVELGEKSFFLWLGKEYGTIMDVSDTNTIYSLSAKSVDNINDQLN